MESNFSTNLIDNLRFQLSQSRQNTRSSKLLQSSYNPGKHSRSKTELTFPLEPIPKDISHRFDTPLPLHSDHHSSEQKLHEILGIPSARIHPLPETLEDLEKEAKTLLSPKNNDQLPNFDTLKQLLNKNNEKTLKKVAEQGGFLYKTQSGLILPQLSSMYDHFTKRRKSNKSALRTDLDLGKPSGRRQVEVIIVWLENMMNTFVNSLVDLPSDERIRRASLINTVCLKEVIRQVSSHCIERGMLLQKIWNAQIDIYDSQDNQKEIQARLLYEKLNEKIRLKDEKIAGLEKTLASKEKELKYLLETKDMKISQLSRKIEDLKAQFLNDRQRIIAAVTTQQQDPNEAKNSTDRRHDQTKIRKTFLKAFNPVVMLGCFDKFGFFHKAKVIQEVNGEKITEDNLDQIVSFVDTASSACQTNLQLTNSESTQTFREFHIFTENTLEVFPDPSNFQRFRRRKQTRSSTCKFVEKDRNFKKKLKKSLVTKNRSPAAINKSFLYCKSLNISKVSDRSAEGNFKKKTGKTSEGGFLKSCQLDHQTLQVPNKKSRVFRVETSHVVDDQEHNSSKELSHSESSISNSSNVSMKHSVHSKLKKSKQKNLKKLSKNYIKLNSNRSSGSSGSKSSISSRKSFKRSSNSKNSECDQNLQAKQSELCEKSFSKEAGIVEVISAELSSLFKDEGQEIALVQTLNDIKSLESLKDFLKLFKTSKDQPPSFHQCTQTDLEENETSNREEIPFIPVILKGSNKNLKNVKRTKNKSLSKLKARQDDPSSMLISDPKVPKTERIRRNGVVIEEFAFGQITKKIQASHPGPKLLSSVLGTIRLDGNLKLSLKSLMKIVSSVYQEKIFLCKENPIHLKSDTSMILYDLLMKKYGLKNVAERHFFQVVKSTLAFRPTCFRVEVFSQFLTGEKETYRLEDWNFWILALEIVESVGFCKVLLDDGASEVFCPLPSALQALSNIFSNKVPEKTLELFQNQVIKMKVANSLGFKRSSTFKVVENVNLDEFLTVCLDLYAKCKAKIKEKLWPLHENDQILTEEEFLQWVKQFALGPEIEAKLFERFSNLQKLPDDRLVKAIKIRSLIALVFENSLVDFKELI